MVIYAMWVFGLWGKLLKFMFHPIPDKLKTLFKRGDGYYDPEFDRWFNGHPFTAPPPPPPVSRNVRIEDKPKYEMSKHKFE
jgi:hypothetical protein